jgi:flagellar protein FlaG
VDIAGVDKIVKTGQVPANSDQVRKKSVQPYHAEPKEAPQNDELAKQLEQIMKELGSNNTVRINYDNDLNRFIIQVLDGETQTVVRQIPSNDFISFAKRFKEFLGLVINRRI